MTIKEQARWLSEIYAELAEKGTHFEVIKLQNWIETPYYPDIHSDQMKWRVAEVKEWYEEEFKPCLCWVSNTNETPNSECNMRLIERRGYSFMSSLVDSWIYAIPLNSEEVLKYCFEVKE